MGAAAIPILFELLKSEEGRELLGKFPVIGKFLPFLQKAAPGLQEALKPATPEQQMVNAFTILAGLMPTDADKAEKFKSAVSLIMDGVSNLKGSLAKEQTHE